MREKEGGKAENPSRNEKRTRENVFLQTTAAFSALLISINVALWKSVLPHKHTLKASSLPACVSLKAVFFPLSLSFKLNAC